MSFFTELKRRKMFRVAVVYAATAFVILQAADLRSFSSVVGNSCGFTIDVRDAKPSGAPMRFVLSLIFALGSFFPSLAPAQIANWQGTVTDNWFNSLNWNPNSVPVAGTNVIINTWSPNPTTIAVATTPDLGAIQIGETGNGELFIESGGKLFNNAIAILGTAAGSQGFAVVQDSGSEWRIDHNLVVGEQGLGLLQLLDQGYLLNNNARIGNSSSGSGSVTLASSATWVSLGNLFVAHTGLGALDIRQQSEVYNAAQAYVAYAAGSDGRVRVRQGGGWASLDDVFIGRLGQGKLDIESGGMVVLTNNSSSFVGVQNGGTGEVTVTGANSLWSNSASLIIGAAGNGTLNIADGAEVRSEVFSVGDLAGGVGTATVGNGGQLNVTGQLYVGRWGTGSLTIDGGEVSNGGVAVIGGTASNPGAGEVHLVTTSALGGRWHSQSDILVGWRGTALLTVASSTEVESGGRIRIATEGGATGTVSLRGSLTASAANGGTQVGGGGTLTGTGTVNGGLSVAAGGVVAPGLSTSANVGRLNVNGALNLSSPASVIEMRLGVVGLPIVGPVPVSDDIAVSGNLVLNGQLHLSALAGPLPGTYTLMTYGGTLSGNGLTIASLPTLPAGHTAWIDTTTQPGEVLLVVGELGDEVYSDRFEG